MLRVILRDIASAPQIRLFSSSTCLPLTVPATPKRPSFIIRLMTRDEVKASDRLQRYSNPPYLVEDYSLLLRRFDIYPHGSLVACMPADDILRHTKSKELPEWAVPDSHGSVVIGYLVFFPWPERFASGHVFDLGSEADLSHIEEAVRAKSTLAMGDETCTGLKKVGIGGELFKVGMKHCKHLGFKRILGAARNENVTIWGKMGFKEKGLLPKPLAVPGHSTPAGDEWHLLIYDF